MKVLLVAVIVAFLIGSASTGNAGTCADMTGLPPLESASADQKPIRVVVEALLNDAETLYKEGSHIIAQKPQTSREARAISESEAQHVGGESFHLKECNFQETLDPMIQNSLAKFPKDMSFTIVRINQFNIIVVNAVNEALSCSNMSAI